MTRRWKQLIAAGLTALVATGALAQAHSPTVPRQKLTIAVSGDSLVYFPIFVARGAGFFDEEGIDVNWVNVTAASRQVPAVMSGSADVTPVALYHMMDAHDKGLKLVAFSKVLDATAAQIVLTNDALKKTGITPSMTIDEKIKRLKGLNIGVSAPGSGTDTVIRKMFIARGEDPDKAINLRSLGGSGPVLAAFEKKLVDGIIYTSPVVEIIESKGLGKTVIDTFKGDVPELAGVPFMVLVTSDETLKSKPALIAATTRALTRAMLLAQDNPEKAKASIRQYFPDIDEKIFGQMVDGYIKVSPRTPLISPEDLERTAKWLSIGGAPVKVPYDAVVAAEPARSIANQLGRK